MYQYQLLFAAHVIRRGGVIAHPAEAIWGLACDPYNEQSVMKVLNYKQRPVAKGLILVSGQAEHFESLLEPLSSELRARFYAPQKHPTTWLVPDDRQQIPAWIKGEHQAVAVRVIRHPVIAELTRKLGQPIVSTSANPASLAPARSVFKVHQYFANQLDYVLPAPLGKFSRPSIIRDLITGLVLRA